MKMHFDADQLVFILILAVVCAALIAYRFWFSPI